MVDRRRSPIDRRCYDGHRNIELCAVAEGRPLENVHVRTRQMRSNTNARYPRITKIKAVVSDHTSGLGAGSLGCSKIACRQLATSRIEQRSTWNSWPSQCTRKGVVPTTYNHLLGAARGVSTGLPGTADARLLGRCHTRCPKPSVCPCHNSGTLTQHSAPGSTAA
jgi:hypothetical protein